MIQIDKQLIRELFDKAVVSERKRMNFDLRTSPDDGGQRMLNALSCLELLCLSIATLIVMRR